MKTIIVNDVAASMGGALSILRQFLRELTENEMAKSFRWIIFISNDLVNEFSSEYIEIVKVDAKKWRKRIWWDTFGICKWLQDRHIEPSLAVSLMSVGFRKLDAPQIVYMHQPLPFGDFNEFKPFELKARFYRLAIWKWMKRTIRRDSSVVVQTNWMKEAVSNKLRIPKEQIHVIRPKIEPLTTAQMDCVNQKNFRIFYPAVPSVSYKNHELLIRMLASIKTNNHELYSKLRLVFTCKPHDKKLTKYYCRLSKKLAIDEKIDWKGYLSKNEMVREYLESDIVLFPSKLETFGLPLAEAASLGKPVFVLDKPYAHDVLEGYGGVRYLEDDPSLWAEKLEETLVTRKLHFEQFVNYDSGGWSRFVNLIINACKPSEY
ncbi:glycosyltransferase [Mesotoga sp.]|uniref:glycosyltransferase n=1 Tax=Mesotoga sp. TaxID=2053577 RepID=UPI00345EF236